ncbi:MAG: hypothetical protein RPS47_02625 [Colwellia sp.]
MKSNIYFETFEEGIEFIKASFPEVEFNLFKAFIGESEFLSGFSCWVESEEVLENTWSRITSLIGTEYQSKLADDFSSWNIYLAFFTPKKISNALKYTIENDTFFVRKIVFDSQTVQLEKDHIGKYLNDHILGKDIRVDSISLQGDESEPKYTSITQSLLNAKLPLSNAPKDKQLREAWLDSEFLKVDNDED